MNEVIDLGAVRERAEIARSNADAAYREMRENPPLHEAVEGSYLSYGRRLNIEPSIIKLEIDGAYEKRYDLTGRWIAEVYAAAHRFDVKVRSVNFVTGEDLGWKQVQAQSEMGKYERC